MECEWDSGVQKVAGNCTIVSIHRHTHVKSSSDPSPSAAVMSLADWLSLAVPSPASLLLRRETQLFFRDLTLDFLCPGKDFVEIQPGHGSSKARGHSYSLTTFSDCSAESLESYCRRFKSATDNARFR